MSFWLRWAGSLSYLGGKRLEREMNRRDLSNTSRREIVSRQIQRLNANWAHACQWVPHYREQKLRLGLPGHFSDLHAFFSSVPVLTKEELQLKPRTFLADHTGPGKWIRTSGSTGKPLSVFREKRAHRQIRLDTHYHRGGWGIEWHHPSLFLWGDDSLFSRGVTERLYHLREHISRRMKNRHHVNAYFLNKKSLEHCHNLLINGRVMMIYAYSQAALRLAHFCRNRAPAVGLRLVVISSEYADPHSIREMAEVFRCPVVREYGANETGILAADLPGSPLSVMEHRVIIETVKRDDGLYEILATCLENPGYPLFRYRLEDMTSAPLEVPEKGAASLKDILGRLNDQLILPDGKWLHSAYITHAVRAVAPMKRFQIVQKRSDHLHLRLDTDKPLTAEEKNRIRTRIRCITTQSIRITIAENEEFEKTPRGKHRFVIRHWGSPEQRFGV